DYVGYQNGLQPDAQGPGLEILTGADRPRLPFDWGQSEQRGQNEDQIGEQSDSGQLGGDLEICVMRDLLPIPLVRVDMEVAHSETDYRMSDGQVYAALPHLASLLRRTLGAAVPIEDRSETVMVGAGENGNQDDRRYQAGQRGPGSLAVSEFPEHYRRQRDERDKAGAGESRYHSGGHGQRAGDIELTGVSGADPSERHRQRDHQVECHGQVVLI